MEIILFGMQIFLQKMALCKSRNGESGNRMRGMLGTRVIRLRTWESSWECGEYEESGWECG